MYEGQTDVNTNLNSQMSKVLEDANGCNKFEVEFT